MPNRRDKNKTRPGAFFRPWFGILNISPGESVRLRHVWSSLKL